MAQYQFGRGGAVARANSKGGEFSSFRSASGREYIWQPDPNVWAGQSPILFPIVGSLKDDRVLIGGKPYSMFKHGLIRGHEFELERRGEDFVQLVFHSTPEMLERYPFAFSVHITHTVRADGFDTEFLVDNRSAHEMPMCIGGHPGFICPMNPGEQFTDYQLVFERPETGETTLAPKGYLVTGTEKLDGFVQGNTLPLDHRLFDERDALIFNGLNSREVRLVHRETGKGLSFSFPKFEALGVWTAPFKNAGYVCLEPWQGIPALVDESGNFEDKPHVQMVRPGESYKLGYSMRILE